MRHSNSVRSYRLMPKMNQGVGECVSLRWVLDPLTTLGVADLNLQIEGT